MEQHLGHLSFYENLRQAIEPNPAIDSHWVQIGYRDSTPMWDRMPSGSRRVRDAVIGRAQVRRGLDGARPDVAFFNTQVPAALGGRTIRRQPYVLCTDMTPRQVDRMAAQYDHRPDGNGPVARYKHAVNTRLFRDAARIVPWSNWVRQSLIDEYSVSPDRIEVVAPGVDLDMWRPQPVRRTSGPLRILFVGGDFHRKGGQDLLDAFHRLPEGTAELHLVTRSVLDDSANGVIVHRNMTPNSPELVELFATSDVFVLPSRAEAFGIAATEATAIGLPVIGTKVGGLVDIIEDNVTGYLIDVGDTTHLTALLTRLAADPELRQRLSDGAITRGRQLFDASQNAERIATVLTDAAQATPIADRQTRFPPRRFMSAHIKTQP